MKVYDRFILFLFSIIVLLVSAVAALIGIGLLNYNVSESFLEMMYYNSDVQLSLAVIGIIVFILSLYLLSKTTKIKETISSFRQSNELGEIRVSVETIENLVVKIATKIKGVRELKAKVKPEENDTVTIVVKINFDGETPIPQITQEIQQTVKTKLEQITGITVGQVHVLISNVSQTSGRKVVLE